MPGMDSRLSCSDFPKPQDYREFSLLPSLTLFLLLFLRVLLQGEGAGSHMLHVDTLQEWLEC